MTSTEFRQAITRLMDNTNDLIEAGARPEAITQTAALVEIAAQLMEVNERQR